ncbi:MAG: amino acid adenylation domain-containing protein [Anaerolineales bacterium]|nr:amino acid adenylation domain-containing protein [Anaerolineales bacterium]
MPKEVIEGFRLSPQQKYLWLAQQAGQPQLYRAQAMLRLEGPLKPAILTAALQHIFNRHEILRTTFHQPAGFDMPLQIVGENTTLPIQHHHWLDLDAAAQDDRLDALFDDFGQQPFDLARSPLWRVAWVTLTPTQHILLMSLPALCADSATLANLLYEISQGYAAGLHGDFLTDEPLQYADLAEWQNELLESAELAAGREFWRKQAWADSLSLKLPFEHATAAGFDPRMVSLRLKSELGELIETTAQTYDVTPAVIWQSCWHMLLWRYSGQSEVLVGLGGDGRTHDELKAALGPLARCVPVSSSLDESMSFAGLLAQLNEAVQAACQWQDFFQWEQTANSEPGFFPFSFEVAPRIAPVTAGDVTFALERQVVHLSRFKAKLVVLSDRKRPAAELHYDANLFKQADMERLAGHLGELLASALAQPEMPMGQLNLLTPAERQQLLVDFNRTEADSSDERCIHQLFEAQAERVPQRTAVVFEGEALTYAELNRRANQLAHYLQALGVGPDTLVAIFVERSLDMIVGMLGILKAGGAYVPFDPTLPKERLAFLLDDTQAPVLLTQSQLQSRLPDPSPRLQRVVLDTDWAQIAVQPEHNPTSAVQNHHLVYVLFTSGSTGQPKGVMVEHRHLLNYIHGVTARLDLPAEANYATVSTFAADLGNTVIFPALCGGGCLHIITHERATDPDALAAYFHRYQVDCLKLVPSHLAALFASTRPEQIMPRQRLILGGETSHWDLVKKAQALAPHCRIFNHYGPTETTVGVLTYPVSQALTAEAAYPTPPTVPLGRPIANTQIYILDAARQPVPVWVPGEVYIGGAGVARGYLNRPELTRERFVTNPFAKEQRGIEDFSPLPPRTSAPSRLYRTGDLARYLPDGTIEFLGRIDNQVKIRGFRIELGEIEALLSQHPAVKETVVMAREDNPGDKRLVAYLVPTPGQTPTSTELRAFLKEKLPEPMLPTAFVLLDKLPLTSNGKINRRALPLPAPASMAFEETYLAPRNDVEEALTELWANMLGLERVGVRV